MLIAVLSGFILAFIMAFTGRWFKGKLSLLLSSVPVLLFLYFLQYSSTVAQGETLLFSYTWVPSMDIDFVFYLDGLSLLFSLLITGIGSLVFIYTAAYMKNHEYLDRFFAYLGMFMASMLGVVLSDNVVTLFIFWELTSISSFFLIGFKNESAESRKSALQALVITGLGGLFLLGAAALLGQITQSYSIQEMLQSGISIESSPLYGIVLLLIFVAAFTKSAQFPFHFWLPGAMTAPTPVSTYLHSATMVKAGIYLLARMSPLLGGQPAWSLTLMIFGGITMLYAAFHAIYRTDLKAILAYSTVSALGILVFLIGMGTEKSLLAASLFILVHALYKASLFLVAGTIDHEAGTRNLDQLGGLRKVLMPLAIAGLLAAISNAGIPPTIGFVGKDLIYEATLGTDSTLWLFTLVALITNILLLAAGFLAGIKPFTGPMPDALKDTHAAPVLMWLPPLLLAVLGLALGLYPAMIEGFTRAVHSSLLGSTSTAHLALWHGFNLVLLLSLVTLALGVTLYMVIRPSAERLAKVERFEKFSPKFILNGLGAAGTFFARAITSLLQNGYLRYYVFTIISFLTLLMAYKIISGVNLYIDYSRLSILSAKEIIIFSIMLASILFAIFTNSRLAAVASMGIMGYSICLLFVFFSAPDLAMTQFAIDTLTVILFVLVLYHLPKYLVLSETGIRLRDAALSITFGLFMTITIIEVLNEPVDKITSAYYAENAYKLAKGKNIVNVILVDFRGIDTMIEITVLAISAVGVFGLLKSKVNENPLKE
ncbi:MAG: putative monovalent cation/H+ antiporter subunit A [Cyclobacteriaceae bacterium]|nr:putative monovalent cation/H+ antiporter subunit A [Cyclobacteriaceae bacterium]